MTSNVSIPLNKVDLYETRQPAGWLWSLYSQFKLTIWAPSRPVASLGHQVGQRVF